MTDHPDQSHTGQIATREKCAADCDGRIYPFMALLFVFLMATLMSSIPVLSATLRSVGPRNRSLALGLQTLVWRLLGSIPGPVIFGVFIDRSCLLWQDSCGQRGSCLVYDNATFSSSMVSLAVTGKSCSLLFAYLAWWFHRRSQTASDNFTTSSALPMASTSYASTNTSATTTAYDNPCVDPS